MLVYHLFGQDNYSYFLLNKNILHCVVNSLQFHILLQEENKNTNTLAKTQNLVLLIMTKKDYMNIKTTTKDIKTTICFTWSPNVVIHIQ